MTARDHLFLVDDNQAFLDSLIWLFEGEGFRVTACSDAREAMDHLIDTTCVNHERRCLVLDIRMPHLSGLDLHDRLNRRQIRLPIIYLTGHADVPLAVQAMKKGAFTLLEKPLQPEALLHAVQRAMSDASPESVSGPTFPDHGTRSSLPATDSSSRPVPNTPPPLPLERLTPREKEVLDCIVQGQANKVCAITLGISIRTVELHRSRLMKKLEVRSGPELIRKVLLQRQTQPLPTEMTS